MNSSTDAPIGPPPLGDPTPLIQNVAATARWVRPIAILGFVAAGFTALAGLVVMFTGLPSIGAVGHVMGLVYIGIAAVYLIPALPLYRFAEVASRLRLKPDLQDATLALHHQNVFWRRLAILAIVSTALTVALIPVYLILLRVVR